MGGAPPLLAMNRGTMRALQVDRLRDLADGLKLVLSQLRLAPPNGIPFV